MNLKKLLFVVLGSAIMGIGIAVTIAADLGSDPMTLFWIGIADQLHISVGEANLLVCAILLTIVFFLDRHQIHVGSILNPIVIALVTDQLAFLDLHALPFAARVALMVAGFAILHWALPSMRWQTMERAPMKPWSSRYVKEHIHRLASSVPFVISC